VVPHLHITGKRERERVALTRMSANSSYPKPKPPHNAFMLFCDRYRDEVKSKIISENKKSCRRPIAPPKDVARRLGERWRSADSGCRKEFVERFDVAYESYKKEVELWKRCRGTANDTTLQADVCIQQGIKKSRRHFDPNKPRPPHNPFMRFCNKYRNVVRDQILSEASSDRKVAPPKEVARRLGERWRNANESEKAVFQTSFSEEYHLYREALDDYKKKKRTNMPNLLSKKRKTEGQEYSGRGRKKRPYRTDPDKPKPPHNAFMLFCDRFRGDVKKEVLKEQIPNLKSNGLPVAPPKEVARRLGKRWREANMTEKSEYLEAFKREYESYKIRLRAYMKKKRGGGVFNKVGILDQNS
jgi:hypothetical protein